MTSLARRGMPTPLLNAVAAVGPGDWVALAEYAGVGRPRKFSWTIDLNGVITSADIVLEGADTVDGVGATEIDSYAGLVDTRRDVVDKSPRFVRANVRDLVGGGTVTITLNL